MKKISKQKLAKLVSKRLGNAIPEAVITDAIGIICQELSSKLERGESICVDNFGVLDVCDVDGHMVQNINTGESQMVEGYTTVKLIPNETLKWILQQRISKYRKKEK